MYVLLSNMGASLMNLALLLINTKFYLKRNRGINLIKSWMLKVSIPEKLFVQLLLNK